MGIVLHEYSHWTAATLLGYSASVNLSLDQPFCLAASIIGIQDKIIVALAGGMGVCVVFSLVGRALSNPMISVPLQFIAMLNGTYAFFELFYALNWISAWQAQIAGNLLGAMSFALLLFMGRDEKVIDLLKYMKLGVEP